MISKGETVMSENQVVELTPEEQWAVNSVAPLLRKWGGRCITCQFWEPLAKQTHGRCQQIVSERKLKAEKYKIRIVSAWPDGVCCKTCKYWNEKGFGNGICDAVTIGADFGLVGGGQLRTFELFACSEWEAKESE